MYLLTRPVVTVLIAGTLGFLCYELWYWAEAWVRGTFLGDFPLLIGLGAVIVFLSAAELVIEAGRRRFSRRGGALH
jgi:hypothetical protein